MRFYYLEDINSNPTNHVENKINVIVLNIFLKNSHQKYDGTICIWS